MRGFALGRPFDPACVDGADVVVHAAVVPHRGGATDTVGLNVEGARQLRAAAFAGGGGAIFGRAGLLAHTYMLGPNGDSNGCVSFRDYNAFLQAYKRGEVRRLVVVARM